MKLCKRTRGVFCAFCSVNWDCIFEQLQYGLLQEYTSVFLSFCNLNLNSILSFANKKVQGFVLVVVLSDDTSLRSWGTTVVSVSSIILAWKKDTVEDALFFSHLDCSTYLLAWEKLDYSELREVLWIILTNVCHNTRWRLAGKLSKIARQFWQIFVDNLFINVHHGLVLKINDSVAISIPNSRWLT